MAPLSKIILGPARRVNAQVSANISTLSLSEAKEAHCGTLSRIISNFDCDSIASHVQAKQETFYLVRNAYSDWRAPRRLKIDNIFLIRRTRLPVRRAKSALGLIFF